MDVSFKILYSCFYSDRIINKPFTKSVTRLNYYKLVTWREWYLTSDKDQKSLADHKDPDCEKNNGKKSIQNPSTEYHAGCVNSQCEN